MNPDDPRLPERFWEKVSLEPNTGCWLWTGATSRGYGRTWFAGGYYPAHRVAYAALVGVVPGELDLDHLCRTRPCVNPAHLEPVTRAENSRRGLTGYHNLRKTQCPHGHEYTAVNTYRDPQGKRHCRLCKAERKRTAA